MDKGKARKNVRSKNHDGELDLTLRLSLPTNEEQKSEKKSPDIKLHEFWCLGGDNSNNEVPPSLYPNMFPRQYGPLATNEWGGSFTYGGGAAGLLVAPLRPITVPNIGCSGSTLSSHDKGFLPSTGFATPSRKRPTNEDGKFCRSCLTRISPLWRKGPHGPQTLCNKCGLKHSRHLKKSSD